MQVWSIERWLLCVFACTIATLCLLVKQGHVRVEFVEKEQVDGGGGGGEYRRQLREDLSSILGIQGGARSTAIITERGITNTDNAEVLKAFTFGPERFKKLAYSVVAPKQPTDKVSSHSYQTMYGMFLYPLLVRARRYKRKLKFLEIGMGCGMIYGPGRSVALWKGFWGDQVSLWEADLDPNCVKRMQEEGKLDGVNMLVGNQKNPAHLKRWIAESGGAFDVIIDDGGHFNHEIKATIDFLWDYLNPGGLYFIEDLAVGRMIHNKEFGHYDETNGEAVMSDIIQTWTEQLIIPDLKVGTDPKVKARRDKFPVPPGLKWIFCQAEACVLAKCLPDDPGRCAPLRQ